MSCIPCPPIADLTVEPILEAFRNPGHVLPEDEMQAALERWDEILPAAIELFDKREKVGRPGYDRRFFLIHLAGEKCDPRLHGPICRMIIESKDLEAIIGGTITEGLRGILINTFDGDSTSLQAVVEAEKAGDFAQTAALNALAYLSGHGRLTDLDMRAYLATLAEELQPIYDNFSWAGWAESVAQLGFRDLLPVMEQAFSEGLIDELCFELDEMVELLEFSEAQGAKAALASNRIQPYGNAIETLSNWCCFTSKAEENARRREQRFEDDTFELSDPYDVPNPPTTNRFRDVGGIDPCPCGSGKKFKKCCLSAT